MSIDDAWVTLATAVANGDGETLLVLDEQAPMALPARSGLHAVTNRCDIAAAVEAEGLHCTLNDFDLAEVPIAPSNIYYRISKEKAVVNHVLDQALAKLAPGGTLYLAGYKNDGIRSAVKRLTSVCEARVREKKAERSAWLAQIQPASPPTARIDMAEYSQLRECHIEPWPAFLSKPGIFGWNKIDDGSALLAAQLPALFVERRIGTLLDLGCGYGFLSLAAAAHTTPTITATDNNVAAVAACRANFERNGIRGDVVLADCAAGVTGSFDLVLCNPPFHRGFSVAIDLIDAFVEAAAKRLNRDGVALFVVHRTVHLAERALKHVAATRVLAANAQFEVVELTAPRL